MVVNGETIKSRWWAKIEEVFSFDLRSLALLRMGLALVIIADLIMRSQDLTAHYSDNGVLPRTALINQIINPWYWSIHLISGQTFVQGLLFLLAGFIALAMLVGYRTRLATIASWALVISLHNRNPALIFAADDVLRALLFWAIFLPLGACYSLDSALNSSKQPLPKTVFSAATIALMVQQVLIYAGSAAFKTKSELWWPQGDAVYYALSFDQYATGFGLFLLSFPPIILKLLTFAALWFEWLGPLMIFIPWRVSFFRCLAVVSFILLHIGFGLCFELGIFPYLSVFSWLAFIPTAVWDHLEEKIKTKERQGLIIYYDVDCGFCKKIVYLIRTFLILPGTPLLVAQDEDSIYQDMQKYNSWVVVDWEGNRRFKWEGIAYVVSLSPVFKPLATVLRWKPLMSVGTKFYEAIATNRKLAGKFTAPFKFRPLDVHSSLTINLITLFLLFLTLIWNLKSYVGQTVNRRKVQKNDWISFTHKTLSRRTFQRIDVIGYLTRLDQSWSIFAPNPPRDDGWHLIQGKLKDGREVDVLTGKAGSVSWEKPTREQRNKLYHNMQVRTYFINLNRAIGRKLYPHYGKYLCHDWNQKYSGKKQLESFDIYFMDERTVAANEQQNVEKTKHWEQDCFDKKS